VLAAVVPEEAHQRREIAVVTRELLDHDGQPQHREHDHGDAGHAPPPADAPAMLVGTASAPPGDRGPHEPGGEDGHGREPVAHVRLHEEGADAGADRERPGLAAADRPGEQHEEHERQDRDARVPDVAEELCTERRHQQSGEEQREQHEWQPAASLGDEGDADQRGCVHAQRREAQAQRGAARDPVREPQQVVEDRARVEPSEA
jgi:hypothetical protein